MDAIRISFAEAQFLDLAEQDDYVFPHFVQRLVLPLVVRDEQSVRPLGSGFLIGPHLMVTARHVIDDELDRVLTGRAALAALYITGQTFPGQLEPWGGPLAVRHASMAAERTGHDLALLTVDFPYLPDGHPASPNALPLTFKAPTIGTSVLVLGYSEMEGGRLVQNGESVELPHTQRVRASQGRIREIHAPRRDAATLNFPVFRSDYESPHGMSGGPVIAADGKVVGAVCSSFKHSEAGEETSYASLVAPLLLSLTS